MEEKWKRIGYIVKGGPDDAHKAINNNQTKQNQVKNLLDIVT